jgi:hypothetical protein
VPETLTNPGNAICAKTVGGLTPAIFHSGNCILQFLLIASACPPKRPLHPSNCPRRSVCPAFIVPVSRPSVRPTCIVPVVRPSVRPTCSIPVARPTVRPLSTPLVSRQIALAKSCKSAGILARIDDYGVKSCESTVIFYDFRLFGLNGSKKLYCRRNFCILGILRPKNLYFCNFLFIVPMLIVPDNAKVKSRRAFRRFFRSRSERACQTNAKDWRGNEGA